MMANPTRHIVLCNGAAKSLVPARKGDKEPLRLDYSEGGHVRLRLPDFVRSIGTLPNRVLDLLEIAAYVFAADRLTDRGAKDLLVYDSWSRVFLFAIKVRDVDFWNDPVTKEKLKALLLYISGDRDYQFRFVGGHTTAPAHLFDHEEFLLEPSKPHHVMLFSGGLDSLAGAVHRLSTSSDIVCLVSHRSQPSTIMTQNKLVSALSARFTDRVRHYHFSAGLANGRAVSETQRTRTFIYGAIAFALASGLSQKELAFYENGITSLNFARRQDAINSRASRTTHPKTMRLLKDFLSHVMGNPFSVENAFRWKTKAEVMQVLAEHHAEGWISSAVTCSKTSMAHGDHTHCGGCFQCVDRRFSISATQLTDYDQASLYALDFLTEPISDPESKTALIDYARLGLKFANQSADAFYDEYLSEISEAIEPSDNHGEIVLELSNLAKRFGQQTVNALHQYNRHADITRPTVKDSLLDIIDKREYLKLEPERLAERICERLNAAIPTMFARQRPADENDFNDKMHGLLKSESDDYRREFPVATFALAKVIPDHEFPNYNVLIESKYLRGSTTASKITDALAADLVKYPSSSFVVFALYDPERSIRDDVIFARDIEKIRRCRVLIMR